MQTLILKTEGLSAYGLQTFDVHRKVNHFPTRSAVIGLLAAALGIERTNQQKLFELSESILVAVQVNNAGEKMMDYHTVQNFRSPDGKIQKGTKPTYREYWCDSEYTFAISAPCDLIQKLVLAVKTPKFTLFQGRKSCPLTRPLFEGVMDVDNPAIALKHRAEKGQIFSDMQGENLVATLQVRDKLTPVFRKYAMRTVFVSGQLFKEAQEVNHESA
jgi:CRISPR system Cascade subunit CasD